MCSLSGELNKALRFKLKLRNIFKQKKKEAVQKDKLIVILFRKLSEQDDGK